MIVPMGVASCLYGGIVEKIDFVKKQIEWGKESPGTMPKSFLERYYKDITEAVDFYNKHCVLSAKYLNDAFDELTVVYKEFMGIGN